MDTIMGGKRFRMKLNAPDRQIGVAKPHNFPVSGFGGDLKTGWEGAAFDHKGMIAGGIKRAFNVFK